MGKILFSTLIALASLLNAQVVTAIEANDSTSPPPPPAPTESTQAGGQPENSVVPATTRAQAAEQAKGKTGRSDPMAPVKGFKPFPSNSALPVDEADSYSAAQPAKGSSDKSFRLVPPPPPNTGSISPEDLPVSELPVPPERPSISDKLKLTGIVGQKGLFIITDMQARRQNKWPQTLVLGPGDRFESVEVVSIGLDSVLLEENGERTTKRLERIH